MWWPSGVERYAAPLPPTVTLSAPEAQAPVDGQPAPASAAAPASTLAAALPGPPNVPSELDRALGRPIGSEGYGAAIRRVLESGTPAQALAASRTLGVCEMQAVTLDALHASKAQLPGNVGAQAVGVMEREARRCQTVTPELQAQRRALAERALDARVPGAAGEWANVLSMDADAAERKATLQRLRDNLTHDPSAWLFLAEQGGNLGVSDLHRAAFALAFEQRYPQGWLRQPHDFQAQKPFQYMPMLKPVLSAEQQAAAAEIARHLLDELKP